MRRLLPLALLLAPLPAFAADRSVGVGSFERVRVEGPFEVRIAAGSPRARVSGDARAIEAVEVQVNGTTLQVRPGNGWGERARPTQERVVVTLSTPMLASVVVVGGASVTVAGLRAPRVDMSISGTGRIAATGIAAERLTALLVGTGSMTLAGRAAEARLTTNGPATLDAAGLATDALTVRLDGAGETRASARYTAQVTSTGLGKVTVTGSAKCTVSAAAGGVICGASASGT